jgi:hypothetical protein
LPHIPQTGDESIIKSPPITETALLLPAAFNAALIRPNLGFTYVFARLITTPETALYSTPHQAAPIPDSPPSSPSPHAVGGGICAVFPVPVPGL